MNNIEKIRHFKQKIAELDLFVNLYQTNSTICQGLRALAHNDADLAKLFTLINQQREYLNNLIAEALNEEGYKTTLVEFDEGGVAEK